MAWTQIASSSGITAYLKGYAQDSSRNQIYFLKSGGTVLRSWDGTTWASHTAPTSNFANLSITYDSTDDRVAIVGSAGGGATKWGGISHAAAPLAASPSWSNQSTTNVTHKIQRFGTGEPYKASTVQDTGGDVPRWIVSRSSLSDTTDTSVYNYRTTSLLRRDHGTGVATSSLYYSVALLNSASVYSLQEASINTSNASQGTSVIGIGSPANTITPELDAAWKSGDDYGVVVFRNITGNVSSLIYLEGTSQVGLSGKFYGGAALTNGGVTKNYVVKSDGTVWESSGNGVSFAASSSITEAAPVSGTAIALTPGNVGDTQLLVFDTSGNVWQWTWPVASSSSERLGGPGGVVFF